MAVTLEKPKNGEAISADRRLWLNADRTKVLEDGDPEAAYLLASPGTEIDPATAKRYDLLPEASKGAGEKAIKGPPEDKSVKKPSTKASKAGAGKQSEEFDPPHDETPVGGEAETPSGEEGDAESGGAGPESGGEPDDGEQE